MLRVTASKQANLILTTQYFTTEVHNTVLHNTQHSTSQLKGSVKEPNKFHIYETEKITRKSSDSVEYIKLFGSFTRDRHARRI